MSIKNQRVRGKANNSKKKKKNTERRFKKNRGDRCGKRSLGARHKGSERKGEYNRER